MLKYIKHAAAKAACIAFIGLVGACADTDQQPVSSGSSAGEQTIPSVPTLPSQVDWAIIPDTVDGLRPLNTEQLRQLRRSATLCGFDMMADFSMQPCVTSGLDSYILEETPPEMQAFHFGMMRNMRYNTNRTLSDMGRFLSRRNEMFQKYDSGQ